MKLACLSFTERGYELGERLIKIPNTLYRIDHFSNSRIPGGIKGLLNNHWDDFDGFIFISATGIAVRMIHPFIKSKLNDPAIIVIDDFGKYAISLLSGHIGGANKVVEWIGESIGSTPVITTASDNRGIESIDIFAQNNNYYMEDLDSVTQITAMMVNGRRIGIYTEDEEIINYDNIERIDDLESMDLSLDGAIIVSSKHDIGEIKIPHTVLRPKCINIGLGCRKGVETDTVIQAIKASLLDKNISYHSIKAMGTVEVKRFEIGIIKAAVALKCQLKIFMLDDIRPIEDLFEKSQFVKDTIDVYSVSEPCAYLLGGELITRKARYNGVTISVSKE